MNRILSLTQRLGQASRLRMAPTWQAAQPRRYAHQSYGNEQSGHEQGINEENPKRHLEHPGPEAPASKESSGQSQSTSSKSSSTDSNSSAGGAQPKITNPKSAAEENDPEVRKHNEEMRHRADRSANQLSEDDNKVDKNFWKGDVGDIKGKDK